MERRGSSSDRSNIQFSLLKEAPMQSLPIAAFTAGLLSFLSPCVLPLVPGYISLISGAGVEQLKQHEGKLMRSVLLNSVLFIMGFSLVFLALGAVASTIGQLVRQ